VSVTRRHVHSVSHDSLVCIAISPTGDAAAQSAVWGLSIPPLKGMGFPPPSPLFCKKHGFSSLEIGPGVRLVAGEDGWKKFVASNTGYQISKAHTAALAIDPAWFKLGGKS
jgi:hypothetical protein